MKLSNFYTALFRTLSCVLTLIAALTTPAQAATLAGQRFEDQIQLGRQDLQLNGLGIRSIFFFKAYVAGLYLVQKTQNGSTAISASGPKRLQLRMLLDVSAQDINQALVDGMRKNVNDAQWAAMQERVAVFSATINALGNTRSGDTIDLDFVPERGLSLAINGKAQNVLIAGADFYQALLAIFVGDDPVDTRLRTGLLGQ
jgi:Chalcone isomerase-like